MSDYIVDACSLFRISKPKYLSNIENYKTIKNGWYHGVGLAPSPELIDKLMHLVKFSVRRFLSVDTALGLEGELQIVLFKNNNKNNYIEITIESSDKYTLSEYKYVKDSFEITRDIEINTLSSIEEQIINFSKKDIKCKSLSESSQNQHFILASIGIQALPLKTITEESPSYVYSAQQNQVLQYAGT